jgi:hypothetical protein
MKTGAILMLLASQYDKSKYLKAADLDHEKKFRIKAVTEEMIGQDRDKEKKLVVWFTNDERGLVLNRINNRAIRGAFGDDVAGWANKIIVVFPTTAEFRGKMGPALRVRIPPPKQAGQAEAVPKPSPKPSSSGNGAAVTAKAEKAADDPEVEPDPVPSLADDLKDEIDF